VCCSTAFVLPGLVGMGGIAYVGGMGSWVTVLSALGVAAALSIGVMRYRRKRARCLSNCASVADGQCVKGG
jgi:hypothetical protein